MVRSAVMRQRVLVRYSLLCVNLQAYLAAFCVVERIFPLEIQAFEGAACFSRHVEEQGTFGPITGKGHADNSVNRESTQDRHWGMFADEI